MKRTALRRRFWIECVAFAVASVLAALTLVLPYWIEVVFGVDPDAHSGELEVAVTLVASAIALAIGVMAGVEWRRAARPRRSQPIPKPRAPR
jgi:hypothetical protein